MEPITTLLCKWHHTKVQGTENVAYTRDSWVLPQEGTEIWCTAWPRGQTITPYGDGTHVVVGGKTYHKDQLMETLCNLEQEGHTWGIDGVSMTRAQRRLGSWVAVEV